MSNVIFWASFTPLPSRTSKSSNGARVILHELLTPHPLLPHPLIPNSLPPPSIVPPSSPAVLPPEEGGTHHFLSAAGCRGAEWISQPITSQGSGLSLFLFVLDKMKNQCLTAPWMGFGDIHLFFLKLELNVFVAESRNILKLQNHCSVLSM